MENALTIVGVLVVWYVLQIWVLPKLGVHHGMRLFLTGETFDAARALGYGLLHRVAPPGDLGNAVQAEVDLIALGGPKAVGEAKRLVRSIPRLSMDDGFAYAQAKIAELFSSPEAAEGMAAFAGKRKAAWAEPKD